MSDPKLRPGTNYCKCSACGEYFSNVNNFDKHRRGMVCTSPETVRGKAGQRLLTINDKGYWVSLGKPPQAQNAA